MRKLFGALAALAVAAFIATAVAAASGGVIANEINPNSLEVDRQVPNSQSAAHVPSDHVPRPTTVGVSDAGAGFGGFAGLTHRDQRLADGGNQFSLEPPDQGMCVGNGQVIDTINDAFAVYTTSGSRSNVEALVPFWFPGQHEATRNSAGTIVAFGPFVSDPKCYFDPGNGHWYMTALEIDQDAVTGDFTGGSSLLIAVSKTSAASTNPANWYLYRVNSRNDGTGGTPVHPGCPCFGDQPLIGADRYGFYITTNEFSISPFGAVFNGAQVYAFDKDALAAGRLKMQLIDGAPIPLAEGPAYSLQPATSPSAGSWSTAANGTEYLMSALDFDATLDNRVAAWALTNTRSLTTGSPSVHLQYSLVGTQVYGQPPDAAQKAGPTPLADAVNGGHEELIAGNDDRMEQVVYANGNLWAGLNTVIKTDNGPSRVGAAWFVISPSLNNAGTLSAQLVNNGIVAVNRESLLYPSIGVTPNGQGVMTFSLVGPDYFPSAAFTRITAAGTEGVVHIGAAGTEPDDGFTGYAVYGGSGTGRWGDYSAAVADASGNIWLAQEYIPGGARTALANWGTFVSQVRP
jgi:hypothetical protein